MPAGADDVVGGAGATVGGTAGAAVGTAGLVASLLAPVMGSLISSAAGARSSKRQMAFQKEMSNTAHQREIADLRKAGLNPILTATGGSGASQPNGSMFTPSNPLESTGRDFVAALQTRQNIKQSNAAIALTKSQIDTQTSQQNANNASAYKSYYDSQAASASAQKMIQETQNSALQGKLLQNELNRSGVKGDLWRAVKKPANFLGQVGENIWDNLESSGKAFKSDMGQFYDALKTRFRNSAKSHRPGATGHW